MATRARLIARADAAALCRCITSPTLVVTGEPGLDHVIAGDAGSAYTRLIGNAQASVLAGTGHLGIVTKPGAFAATVKTFADAAVGAARTTHDAA